MKILRRDARRASKVINDNANGYVHGAPDVCDNPGMFHNPNVNDKPDACHASLRGDCVDPRTASWDFNQNVNDKQHAHEKPDACHASLR